MERYVIRANGASKYGYDFVEIRDDGSEVVTELRSKTTDGYLRFPSNPLGQIMIAIKKLEAHDGDYELKQYEGHHRGGTSNGGTSTKHEDLLNALALCLDKEERETFTTLCEKAKTRFEIFKKKEALRKQIEAAQAALAAIED